ncbi:MAG: 7-cyano-7-deazaguanine synthase, partial [Candidatus Omnitrophota bacterium]
MKAIVLLSGGLDSTLVARIIKNEGIEAIALNFKTPFCLCDGKASSGCFSHSRKVAQDLGVEFRVMNVAEDFFRIVENPRHGYGSNMNPCIDCRILKFSKAKAFMQEAGASFIVTGEVVGQRPMSQHKATLAIIDKESGLEGLVLRPLSAQLLPETIPEKEGWISRQKMLGFSGRGRRPQMELAKAFHIKDYPCPAGGCLLTDPAFSKRIRDLMQYDKLSLNNVELLKVGRHFRLSPKARLVVGRNELENARLDALKEPKDHLFMPKETAGPTALGRGQFSEELICFSCGIVSHYCDGH